MKILLKIGDKKSILVANEVHFKILQSKAHTVIGKSGFVNGKRALNIARSKRDKFIKGNEISRDINFSMVY